LYFINKWGKNANKKNMVKIMVKKRVKMIGRKGRKTAPKTETFYRKKG
jgi:hypothetical protein